MTGFKKIFSFKWWGFCVLLVGLLLVKVVIAQENQEAIAQKYGITFPIAELGSCTDVNSCRTFCEDPVNAQSCIDFAKSKGFYQEDSLKTQKDKVLEAAKQKLGCDSYGACLNFCEIPGNYEKCHTFAQSQGITGGLTEDPSRTQVIQRAKEVLGCDSATGCQALCSKEENRQKCSKFAREVGLRGGEQRVGPGGCTSEETCRAFCSDPANFQICRGFSEVSGGQFQGPGGCNSESSCRSYCQEHESECRSFGGSNMVTANYNPAEMCNRTPNCSWIGNNCQCGFYGETEETRRTVEEYAAFCRNNPNQCRPGQTGGFDTNQMRQQFEDYCRNNPDRCAASSNTMSRESQESACRAGGGTCDWSSGVCNCQGYHAPQVSPHPNPSGSTYVQPNYSPTPYSDPATACQSAGCTWSNNTCQCSGSTGGSTGTYSPPPGGQSYDPATECAKTSGCSWNGSSCQCSGTESSPPPSTSSPPPSGTQGVSTSRGLWQVILDWLGW